MAAAAAAAKSLQSRPTLCDPIDGSPPGSPVPGILQPRTLERVAISFSMIPPPAKQISTLRMYCVYMCAQSCLTLHNLMDCSLLGSSAHGIFQARVLEWVAIAFSGPTLCDPMNHSTPGLPVHHQLPEFTQTHVHRVGDAIQPSHPLSSPSPAPNPSQHPESFPVSQLFA